MEENISQVQPVEAQPKPAKPWLKIILFSTLGLVLTGAVFGVYKLGQKQTVSFPSPSPTSIITSSPEATPTPTITPTPILDPTANWKTYTNTKLNFLIKYPSEWAIDDSDTGPIEKQINIIRFYQSLLDQTNKTLNALMVTIYIEDNIRNVSLTNLEKNLEEVKTFGDNNILGIKGYDKQYLKENHKVYLAYIIKNNLIYTLTTGPRVINDDNIKAFDLILSTFRFLPSAGSGQGE